MRSPILLTLSTLGLAVSACGGPSSVPDAAPDSEPAAASDSEAATAPAGEEPSYVVTFRDRTIDLEPHVQGYPYRRFEAFIEGDRLLYFESRPDGRWLTRTTLGAGEIDLSAGERLTDIDWSTRSWWGAEYHESTATYIVWGDERNDERMNLYRLDPTTGEVTALTDNDYTYGLGLSPDEQTLAYIRRTGTEAPFRSCLRLLDLSTGDDTEVLCDTGSEDRFTWSLIDWNPDGTDVLVTIQHDGDRAKENIARIDLTAAEPGIELLLERGVEHVSLGTVRDTYDGERVLVTSSVSGYRNLYALTLGDPELEPLTTLEADLGGVSVFDEDEGTLLAVVSHPWESELMLLDGDGDVMARMVRPTELGLLDAHGGVAYATETSVATPFAMLRVTLQGTELALAPVAGVPDALARQIIHCEPRRVSFPTFDTLSDGSPRMLHAWYLAPSDPPDNSERLVRITSFYGGDNVFSSSAQIMCQAGVATLSPAVRGSWGYGAEFSQLNDGDLGGDEIVDLFYAARWLESEEGFEPAQIGVYGGSHGGYATMRALTFPPETNGRNDSYPFGFGMSHAGFSDILTFYETCNIPDWVVLEAGDPETEADKLRDRSPISHVERLQAPLLLTHGENDWRVPVDESRRFAAAAEELGRPVTYVEFEGQGHGISGLENVLTYYRTIFAFLGSL